MYQCKNCGKDFEKTKHNKFCSLLCYWKSLEGKPTWNFQGEEKRKCLFCGNYFITRKVNSKKFCSRNCADKGRRKKGIKKKRKMFCQVCGKDFFAWNYEINRKFCSRKCLGIANGQRLKGKGHWNWRGGISPRVLNTIEYKLWRKAVFERDNYTCQSCGTEQSGIFQAHHIKSWAKYPKLRFEVSNGQTLCKKCHEKTDTFGVKKDFK